jgi:hypothetical protein
MNEVWVGAQARIRYARTVVRRSTLAPTLVRLAILVAALIAMYLAFPTTPLPMVLALLPALFPRSVMPSGFIGATVVLWLMYSQVDIDALVLWRIVLLAIMLYLVHVGCALAAVLPYDAAYSPGVFRPWIVRAGVVSLLTVAVGYFVFSLPSLVSGHSGLVWGTVLGLVLMITTAGFLAFMGNRRQ